MRVLTYCIPDHVSDEILDVAVHTLETTMSDVKSAVVGDCTIIGTKVRTRIMNIEIIDVVDDNGLLLLGTILGNLICTRCLE